MSQARRAPPRSQLDEVTLTLHPRPRTRGDCMPGGANAARPCPFVSCRHHLGLEVNEDTGGYKILGGWDDGGPSCSLDVADEGEHTLEEVADLVGITRERIRQVEVCALTSMREGGAGKMGER